MEINAGVRPRRRRRFAFPWWSLFLCAPPLFSGCAALAPAHKDTHVTTIRTEPSADAMRPRSADFLLVGRVSVTGGKDSFSAGARWRHSEWADEILLLSPLGQTLAQIQLDPGGAYLTTSEQQSYYAFDVESLTEQVLGWHLPLTGLQYWVQGVNSPATSSEMDVDMDGRIVAIRQDGWNIDYLDYFPRSTSSASSINAEEPLQARVGQPRLLRLKRGGLQIKLVIDAWNPPGTDGV